MQTAYYSVLAWSVAGLLSIANVTRAEQREDMLGALIGLSHVRLGMTSSELLKARPHAKRLSGVLGSSDRGSVSVSQEVVYVERGDWNTGRYATTYVLRMDRLVAVSWQGMASWDHYLSRRDAMVARFMQELGSPTRRVVRNIPEGVLPARSPGLEWEVPDGRLVLSVTTDARDQKRAYGEVYVFYGSQERDLDVGLRPFEESKDTALFSPIADLIGDGTNESAAMGGARVDESLVPDADVESSRPEHGAADRPTDTPVGKQHQSGWSGGWRAVVLAGVVSVLAVCVWLVRRGRRGG